MNLVYGNAGPAMDLQASNNNTLVANSVYGNSIFGITSYGIRNSLGATGNVCASCQVGYSTSGVASPDGQTEILFDNSTTNYLILKNTPVNPSPGIDLTGFAKPGSYLLIYSTTTGLVQVYGDYQLAGSTFTLDYANELYASTATTPADMSGHGNLATVNQSYDANAVSQLVTLIYNGSTWDVNGSSTGVICTGLSAGSAHDCPNSGSKQFNITITNGSPVSGDILNFGLVAASSDAYKQKTLQFAATTGSGFNHDRSKIEIPRRAPGSMRWGCSTAPTIITQMASGGTYYTFVDSGAFTVQYASFTYMDESGVQLFGGAGAGPWSINYSTFDYPGSGSRLDIDPDHLEWCHEFDDDFRRRHLLQLDAQHPNVQLQHYRLQHGPAMDEHERTSEH